MKAPSRPSAALDNRLRALVVAHDARATGGVNNFLRVMRRCYRDRVAATRFANGPRTQNAGWLSKALRMAKDYVNFAHLLRRKRFDVLHLNPTLDLSSTPRELVFVWLAWLLQRRMKRIVFYRGWRTDSFAKIEASPFYRALFLATHRRVDRVLVLAQEFADALIGLGVDESKIFVGTTMFEGDLFKGIATKDYDQRRTILFLARFLPEKGGLELIQAFSRVAPQFPGWSLIMGGGGPDRERLVAAAQASPVSGRITFPGYVRGTAKSELLRDCSLFALPTTHMEGMPNAILEAMAAGQVIVTTPVGGIKDVVRDGTNGSLLSAPTMDAIAEALRFYMSDEAAVRQIGERNREAAWANYESSIVANRVADHYHDTLAGLQKGTSPQRQVLA